MLSSHYPSLCVCSSMCYHCVFVHPCVEWVEALNMLLL
jgi:hypothetical protein